MADPPSTKRYRHLLPVGKSGAVTATDPKRVQHKGFRRVRRDRSQHAPPNRTLRNAGAVSDEDNYEEESDSDDNESTTSVATAVASHTAYTPVYAREAEDEDVDAERVRFASASSTLYNSNTSAIRSNSSTDSSSSSNSSSGDTSTKTKHETKKKKKKRKKRKSGDSDSEEEIDENDERSFDELGKKKQFVLEIMRDDYKALYRFLRLVRESLWSSFQIYDIVSFTRFNNYDINIVNQSKTVAASLDADLHSFVDRINFYLLRVLAFIRSIPGLESVRLLDVLMNEQAADHYAALVVGLWKDCIVDKGLQFQTEYVLQEGDDQLITLHLDYFRSLTKPPEANLKFLDVESFNFERFESADEAIEDSDMFETWAHPYNFFARLVMQAVHKHEPDELRIVYDNMLIPRRNRIDATLTRMTDVVFNGQTSRGYKDALSLAVARLQLSDSRPVLAWVALSMDNAAYFAHLVSQCTNKASMTLSKAGAREALLRRIDISTEAILRWIEEQYKKQPHS